jgi:hypothetical protein
MFSLQFRPLRSYLRFSFVKSWRKSISGRWKHRTSNVTTTLKNLWLMLQSFPLPEVSIYLAPFKSYSEFYAFEAVRNFFQFWGLNTTPKIIFANHESPNGTSLRKSASIEALWSSWLLPFGLWGSGRIKNRKGKCVFLG